MFVSEIKSKNNLKIISSNINKASRLQKGTKKLQDVITVEEESFFSIQQYQFMIKAMQQLNVKFQQEISNYKSIVQCKVKTQDKNQKYNLQSIPSLSFFEFFDEFQQLFQRFSYQISVNKKFFHQQQNAQKNLQTNLNQLIEINQGLVSNLNELCIAQKSVYEQYQDNTQCNIVQAKLKKAQKFQEELKQIQQDQQYKLQQKEEYLEHVCDMYENDLIHRKECSQFNIDLQKQLQSKIKTEFENLEKLRGIYQQLTQQIKVNKQSVNQNKKQLDDIQHNVELKKDQINNVSVVRQFQKSLNVSCLYQYKEKELVNIQTQISNQEEKEFMSNSQIRKQNILIDHLKSQKNEILTKISNQTKKNQNYKNQVEEIQTQIEQILNSTNNNDQNINYNNEQVNEKKEILNKLKNELKEKGQNHQQEIQNKKFQQKITLLEFKASKENNQKLFDLQYRQKLKQIQTENDYKNELIQENRYKQNSQKLDLNKEKSLNKQQQEINNLKKKILVLNYEDEQHLQELLNQEQQNLEREKQKNIQLLNEIRKNTSFPKYNLTDKQYKQNIIKDNQNYIQQLRLQIQKKKNQIQSLEKNISNLENSSFLRV